MKKNRYYCIPDIHGCSGLLKDALSFIYKNNPDGGKIVFLGDYIDRGPDNLGVINIVMNPPENWEFVCLMGNHEEMFLQAYINRSPFYNITAAKDLASVPRDTVVKFYDDIHGKIDRSIIEWMTGLKLFHIEDKNVFAHAYYDDSKTPENQRKHDCLWFRMDDWMMYANDKQGFYLTHGHTPRKSGPIKSPNRVNLDCGAVFYNRLVVGEYYKDIQGPVDFHEFI